MSQDTNKNIVGISVRNTGVEPEDIPIEICGIQDLVGRVVKGEAPTPRRSPPNIRDPFDVRIDVNLYIKKT